MTSIEANQLSAISRLFSSGVLREMARRGRSPLFARLADESLLMRSFAPSDRVHHLFDSAFSVLKKKAHRHEYIYKAALTHKILLGAHSLQTASMMTEFRVGECKADLAILNGTATVYEIKSERDSLTRLERQLRAYKQVFAKIYVIAGENHIDAIFNSVSSDVGVMRLSNRHQISTLREAIDQPERTSPAAIFDSIRLSEAKKILELNGISTPHLPNTELHSALRSLFVMLSPTTAHGGMVQVLKKTRNLLPLADLIKKLPTSLQPAAMSIPLRKADHERLFKAVNTRLCDAQEWA
jgi:hypothetical protein